jgi:hypothetical protein
MSYALRSAARLVIDDLRHRAKYARIGGEPTLAVFLELQANRLEAPLLLEEAEARARDEEAMAARLYRPLSAIIDSTAATLRRMEGE